jgi:signal transduction histidine kinase
MTESENKPASILLADLVENNRNALLERWTQTIERTLAPKPLTQLELLNSLPDFLDDLIAALQGAIPLRWATDAAKEHGSHRFRVGFDIESVAREYGVLRDCLLELMREHNYSPTPNEVVVLTRCLTDGIALAISQHAREREKEVKERIEFDKQLLGIVSHDLRDPLNVISLSAATMLRRSTLDELESRGLSRILSSAKHATRLTSDLLDYTHARLGRAISIRPKRIDLHSLTRQIVDEIRLVHPDRRIALTQVGDAEGEWDPDRLTQAIFNLVGNAIQHSSLQDPIQVSTRDDGETVLLEVKNQGPPLAPDEIPLLFEAFQRGSNARPETGSLGLGLFIAKQIVLAHAGKIQVKSSAEEGTIFTVLWPRRSVVTEQATKDALTH